VRSSAPGIRAVERETLEDQAYKQLRKAILDGHFGSHERLIQDDLAELLGTSRIPIRDALRRLEADGLVVASERGAYHVKPFGPNDAREVFALRELLEPFAANVAIPRLSEDTMRRLAELTGRLVQAANARDGHDYVATNRRFHFHLYESSGMERLVRMIDNLWSGRPPFTPLQLASQIEQSVAEHVALMEVIEHRNTDRAVALLRMHIRRSGELLIAHLEAGGSSEDRHAGVARGDAQQDA